MNKYIPMILLLLLFSCQSNKHITELDKDKVVLLTRVDTNETLLDLAVIENEVLTQYIIKVAESETQKKYIHVDTFEGKEINRRANHRELLKLRKLIRLMQKREGEYKRLNRYLTFMAAKDPKEAAKINSMKVLSTGDESEELKAILIIINHELSKSQPGSNSSAMPRNDRG